MSRGRKAQIDRPSRVEIWLPESLHLRLKLELFSELEGKVPHGRMSELGVELFTKWLKEERGVAL